MNKLRFIYTIIFIALASFCFCQEPIPENRLEDKVVIGFPGVTAAQLNQLQAEFAKYDQISDAKFISGHHNCMLMTFDLTKHDFTVYAELLKVISQYYATSQSYFKEKAAYDEIMANIGTDTVLDLK